MKNTVKQVLLMALTSLQINSFAQMQSLPLNSSSERNITTFMGITPKKSLAIGSNEVISLSHCHTGGQLYFLFCKTTNGDTMVNMSLLQQTTTMDSVHDFDYSAADSMIYYCGAYNGLGCIGFEYTFRFFSPNYNQILRVDLNGVKKITKIYYYVDAAGKEKLALIADSNKFVDFNLDSFNYEVYVSPYRLLDIAITENYVSVLGYVSNREFIIYAHNKNSISNYQDKRFATPIITAYNNPIGFHFTKLSYDHVLIGFSSEDNFDEFCTIKLPSLSITNDQAIPKTIGKPIIVDLEYCPSSNNVLCLTNMAGLSNIIYTVNPHASSLYTTTAVYPNNNKLYGQEQRLFSIANYDNNYYIALGKDTNNYIYFFDKQIGNFNNPNCYSTLQFNIGMANKVQPNMGVGYTNVYQGSGATGNINFNTITVPYNMVCQ